MRETAVMALLSTSTLEQAAHIAGVSKRTLLRWMKDTEFRAAYVEAKAELLRTAMATLTGKARRAAEVLSEIFEAKPEPNQSARVAAAQATFRLALDAHELENHEERLRKLEEQSRDAT